MIELRNLTKQYGNKNVVNNISLHIHPGVVTGFLGPNGAGKTTTMRMILGLAAPTAGNILIDKKAYASLKNPLYKIGAMMDTNAIDARLTAWQHLAVIAAAAGINSGRVEMEVISVNMLAIDVSTILLIFFTAVLIGREFHNKTIQIYLAATPNRTQYFAVKALFFLGVSLATGVLAALIALGNGWLILEALHHQILSVPEVMQFAAGCIFMPLFYALMTVCAAFFSRSSAVGITIPFIIIFLPAITKLFPQSVQNIFIPILPASAIHSLSGAAEKGTLEDMGSLTALVILGIWSLLACLLALWRFRQKDI